MVTVIYGVDMYGDRAASMKKLVDLKSKTFLSKQEALEFIDSCTYVQNLNEIHNIKNIVSYKDELAFNKAVFNNK